MQKISQTLRKYIEAILLKFVKLEDIRKKNY